MRWVVHVTSMKRARKKYTRIVGRIILKRILKKYDVGSGLDSFGPG
jgi:hypothetical protein